MIARRTAQQPVEDGKEPRCRIWFHLALIFGLIGTALLALGGGWLWTTNLSLAVASEVKINREKVLTQEKKLDEMSADLKELLRRTARLSAVSDRSNPSDMSYRPAPEPQP